VGIEIRPVSACRSRTDSSCVQYFDGAASFDQISYRTGMKRRELDRVLQLYPDDVSLTAKYGKY